MNESNSLMRDSVGNTFFGEKIIAIIINNNYKKILNIAHIILKF